MNELEWLSSHPKEAEKHSGKWIAVTDKVIVASCDSLSDVESSLKKKGVSLKEVMVMKMPRKDEEMSLFDENVFFSGYTSGISPKYL